MAKHKGSTKPLPPMKERDPKAFSLISAEIQRLGVDEGAKYAEVSKPTIYTFLDGSQGVSSLMEGLIYQGVKKKKVADTKTAQDLRNQALEAIIA